MINADPRRVKTRPAVMRRAGWAAPDISRPDGAITAGDSDPVGKTVVIHYTLNTGHSREAKRGEVADDVIPMMAGMLPPGEHALPAQLGRGWRLVVPESPHGWVATLYFAAAPQVTIGVAATAEDAAVVWPALERLYLSITDRGLMATVGFEAPRQPQTLPWCAAAIVGLLGPAAHWIGDFERCVAWAWLESRHER